MSEPLFMWSFLGGKTAVYPDRIIRKVPFGGEKSVPIDKVASVEVSGYAKATVDVITTSGEKITYSLMPNDKEAFKDAIYKAKEMQAK